MLTVGMMQGRLSSPTDHRIQFFPVNTWMDEFRLAREVGFGCIEWLYDLHDAGGNPISTQSGVETARALSSQYGVGVVSLCAHCFIEKPLAGAGDRDLEEALQLAQWLFRQGSLMGIRKIVLPLEDASRLDQEGALDRAEEWLIEASCAAEQARVAICVETTLLPQKLARLLERVPSPCLQVNYDLGNSAGMGYDINEEFELYGPRVGGIHIKDKILHGATVPLGTGSADFAALGRLIGRTNYGGPLILEAARGTPGDELTWARRNLEIVAKYLEF